MKMQNDEEEKMQIAKSKKESEHSNVDLELDVASENFNPLKALYAQSYKVSDKQPKVLYQNMAAFETALKNVGILDVGTRPKTKKSDGTSEETSVVEEERVERRFQEHQMAIRTVVRVKNKHNRNILTQMAQEEGPLKAINEYVEQGKRVHVVVRKQGALKGYVEGKLELFDRHWNLLLSDVVECYEQRKHKYAYDNLVYHLEAQDCSEILKCLGITLPPSAAKSLSRKVVQIKRHLSQLVLRGEHVVLIRSIDSIERF